MNLLEWTNNPLFGVTLTIGTLVVYTLLFGRSKSMWLNPFLFAVFTIMAFLAVTGIPYDHYERGASLVAFFMGPAIVALAVPLYRQIEHIKANALPVLLGITAGVLASILSGIGLSVLLGLSREMVVSMAPKGATSAISMNLAALMGGDPAMDVTFVNIAGIVGYMFASKVYTILRIDNPLARGIGLGTAAHAMGTKRALEMGEVSGAMSSLSIGLAGVLTSFLMPLIIRLLGI